MAEKYVKIGATLDSIATRKDGSIKMVFESQEMNAEEGVNLFSMRNEYGNLLFLPEGMDEVEIPEVPKKPFKEAKTQSQRIRNSLYVLWEAMGSKGSSEDFYRYRTEKIIEGIKEEIEKYRG